MNIDTIKDKEYYSVRDVAKMLDVHNITAKKKIEQFIPKKNIINLNRWWSIKILRVTGSDIKTFILWLID